MEREGLNPARVKITVEVEGADERYHPDRLHRMSIGQGLLWYVQEKQKWQSHPDTILKLVRLWQLAEWKKALVRKMESEQKRWRKDQRSGTE